MVLAHLVFSAVALAANPDFAVGSDATAVKFAGIDFNGWHAVSGFALFTPGLLLLKWPQYTRPWVLAVAALLVGTAIWGLLDEHPLWLLFFPDSRSDAIYHVGAALGFLVLLPLDRRQPVLADA